MKNNKKSEGEIFCFQKSAREFSPITVSADFAALARANFPSHIEEADQEEEIA